MRKYFVIFGFAAAVIAASSVARGGTGEGSTSTGSGTFSSGKVPTFTLDQAILTALQRNPTLLIAEKEIRRTQGVINQVRAQALPQVTARANFDSTDPNLVGARIFRPTNGTTTTPGTTGGAASLVEPVPSQVREVQPPLAAPSPTPATINNVQASDISYSISVLGSQLIFNGTTWPSIRGTFFQRDSAYFAFRNILDQLLATVKTQFYQIVVNRELIKVQEQSVRLLQSQLQDQQNRFEAGTVPRFNVLQAQVALSNQLPQLITARNNYTISQLQLAKTLGLDFDPRRGDRPPLDAVGELAYLPREMPVTQAIALAKENRPFIKQHKAVVLSNQAQVGLARSDHFP